MITEAAAQTTLAMLGKLVSFVKLTKNGSLSDYTKATRVEPIVLLDANAVHLEYTHDILQVCNSMFSAYYLQAISIMVNVGKIDVVNLLEKVNPNRDPVAMGGELLTGFMLSTEAYATQLPGVNNGLGKIATNWVNSKIPPNTPSKDDSKSENIGPLGKPGKSTTNDAVVGFDRDTVGSIRDVTNLSVGHILNVEITSNQHTASIPVTVRLAISAIPPMTLVSILSSAEKNTSVKERFHGWRSGQLAFWRDLVLCQDLIDTHKHTLMHDKSGAYTEILARRTGNRVASVMSGSPSIATASNVVILTEATLQQLELEIGGKLKNFAVRERMFKNTYVMLLVVVDPAWEAVTIYTRGIAIPTELTVKELKSSGRGKGPDVSEILKAYTLGNAPRI